MEIDKERMRGRMIDWLCLNVGERDIVTERKREKETLRDVEIDTETERQRNKESENIDRQTEALPLFRRQFEVCSVNT